MSALRSTDRADRGFEKVGASSPNQTGPTTTSRQIFKDGQERKDQDETRMSRSNSLAQARQGWTRLTRSVPLAPPRPCSPRRRRRPRPCPRRSPRQDQPRLQPDPLLPRPNPRVEEEEARRSVASGPRSRRSARSVRPCPALAMTDTGPPSPYLRRPTSRPTLKLYHLGSQLPLSASIPTHPSRRPLPTSSPCAPRLKQDPDHHSAGLAET